MLSVLLTSHKFHKLNSILLFASSKVVGSNFNFEIWILSLNSIRLLFIAKKFKDLSDSICMHCSIKMVLLIGIKCMHDLHKIEPNTEWQTDDDKNEAMKDFPATIKLETTIKSVHSTIAVTSALNISFPRMKSSFVKTRKKKFLKLILRMGVKSHYEFGWEMTKRIGQKRRHQQNSFARDRNKLWKDSI